MTQAQEVLKSFEDATGTVSLKTLALKAGAVQEDMNDPAVEYCYHFEDGSSIKTHGRGCNYQAWA